MIVYAKARTPIIVRKSELNPPEKKIRLVKKRKETREDGKDEIREFFKQWCIDRDRQDLMKC